MNKQQKIKSNYKIDSLKTLRKRKQLLSEEIEQTEKEIKYDLYLFTHPLQWAATAISQANGNFSAQNLVKVASYSRDFFRIARTIIGIIKVLRRK